MGSSIKENDTMDRRIRKTRAALKGALANLMLVKQVKDISVRELTDLADVNRGTFYLHYKDVFDLLEKTEDDILEEFKETLNEFDEKSVSDDATRFFESVYTLCMKNGDFIRILIGENGDIRFLNSLKELVREKCLNEWSFITKKQRPEQFDSYYAFIVGGLISLLQYWFSSNMKETPYELAIITGDMLSGGLSMKSK